MEFVLDCRGLTIAGKRYGAIDAPHRILALHGWLDSCDSFAPLADALCALHGDSACIVAIDMPGHGRSAHLGASYTFMNYASTVVRVLDALAWRRHQRTGDVVQLHLIGHSMGAAIALLVGGMLAEGECDSICTLDAFLGWGSSDSDMLTALTACAAEERNAYAAPLPVFADLEAAARARMRTQAHLSLHAARLCVARSLRAAPPLPADAIRRAQSELAASSATSAPASDKQARAKPLLFYPRQRAYALPATSAVGSKSLVPACTDEIADAMSPGCVLSALDPTLFSMTYKLTPLTLADVLLTRANAHTPRLTALRASRESAYTKATPLRARQEALLTRMHTVCVEGAHHVHIDAASTVASLVVRALALDHGTRSRL